MLWHQDIGKLFSFLKVTTFFRYRGVSWTFSVINKNGKKVSIYLFYFCNLHDINSNWFSKIERLPYLCTCIIIILIVISVVVSIFVETKFFKFANCCFNILFFQRKYLHFQLMFFFGHLQHLFLDVFLLHTFSLRRSCGFGWGPGHCLRAYCRWWHGRFVVRMQSQQDFFLGVADYMHLMLLNLAIYCFHY